MFRERLGIEPGAAKTLQKDYYRDHGTTLNGLMNVHGVDPEEFLSFVHAIDLSVLEPKPVLRARIKALPGRRFIFTNGCEAHAARVLERARSGRIVRGGVGHPHHRFQPQARARNPMRRCWRGRGFGGQACAMFEDAARNLVPAHELGMTTVWLKNGSVWSKQGPRTPKAESRHIHHETEDLAAFLQTIRTRPS